LTNLKRFLVKISLVPTKYELLAVLRRLDTDGDGKLKRGEFEDGIKSQFAVVNQFGTKMSKGKPTRAFMDGNIGHTMYYPSKLESYQPPPLDIRNAFDPLKIDLKIPVRSCGLNRK
jgi:hypothetical protein